MIESLIKLSSSPLLSCITSSMILAVSLSYFYKSLVFSTASRTIVCIFQQKSLASEPDNALGSLFRQMSSITFWDFRSRFPMRYSCFVSSFLLWWMASIRLLSISTTRETNSLYLPTCLFSMLVMPFRETERQKGWTVVPQDMQSSSPQRRATLQLGLAHILEMGSPWSQARRGSSSLRSSSMDSNLASLIDFSSSMILISVFKDEQRDAAMPNLLTTVDYLFGSISIQCLSKQILFKSILLLSSPGWSCPRRGDPSDLDCSAGLLEISRRICLQQLGLESIPCNTI